MSVKIIIEIECDPVDLSHYPEDSCTDDYEATVFDMTQVKENLISLIELLDYKSDNENTTVKVEDSDGRTSTFRFGDSES